MAGREIWRLITAIPAPTAMQVLVIFALFVTHVAALVLPAAPVTVPAAAAVGRARLAMQFDEEGGMVKEIEEGGMSFEDVMAGVGAEGPKLPAEKAAKLVLKEPEW